MCAAFELNSRVIRPGRFVRAWRNAGAPGRFVWAGFARNEIAGWWRSRGWEPVDVPAEKFAERSDRTRQLTWESIPSGFVIRGIVETGAASPVLKIVTRRSTDDELARYEHDRVPLIEPPLFSAQSLGVEEDDAPRQGELF